MRVTVAGMISPIDAPWWAVLTLYAALTTAVLFLIIVVCVWAEKRDR